MFNLWSKLNEKGLNLLLKHETEITPLEWIELGEVYPQYVPAQYCNYDLYSDPALLRNSPFLCFIDPTEKDDNTDETNHEIHPAFSCRIPSLNRDLNCSVDVYALQETLMHGADATRDVLVCSCGIAGCAGFGDERCHISSKMVHWSIQQYDENIELFFERQAYEQGAIALLKKTITTNSRNFFIFSAGFFEKFKEETKEMLRINPHYRRLWNTADVSRFPTLLLEE